MSVPRVQGRGVTLSTEATPNSVWPAPAQLQRAGNVTWSLLGKDVAATGPDCPFTQHGPAPLSACLAACVSAGPQSCTDVNWSADIGDCVFRRCDAPLAPVLTPTPGYDVWGLTRPVLPSYGLSPATFRFVITGQNSPTLTQALARAVNATFAYGPGAAGAPADVATLEVNVLSPGEALTAGVNESYSLALAPAGNAGASTLTAETVFGALRGLETFAQLVSYDLAARAYSVEEVAVVDAPRFAYRGVLLDTSRHFLSLSALKQVVEVMGWAKLNTLAIHFSDDQSWPLAVASAPLLALRSAYSNFSHTYTPAMMAELVAFARARGVRVIPELDSPSHASSMTTAYPQYAAQAVDPTTNASYLCMVDPSREEVYDFLAGIWRDAADMFPDAAFRIGGDELQGCWADSPAVVAWMRAQGFDVTAAYHYYIRRLIGIMRGLSPPRSTHAWLDVDGFPDKNETWARDYADVTLDVWSGCYSGVWQDDVARFTAEGGKVIVSGPFYITQQNGAPETPHFTWEQMYATDLANFTNATAAQVALVQGGELCVWDDAAQTDSADLMVSLTPYILAVGEAWWSPRAATAGVAPDAGRLHDFRCKLVQRGLASHPIFAFGTACPFEYEVPAYKD